MAAVTFAMEAMTNVTASLIDRGLEDYMLETAMLKVFTTEALWEIVNDAFQIHGGAAYFTDLPLERMLRDARINQIGEGANEVLTSFIALVGMRGPGCNSRKSGTRCIIRRRRTSQGMAASASDRAGAALHARRRCRCKALELVLHRATACAPDLDASISRSIAR